MAEERKFSGGRNHKITMDDREKLFVTGVADVLSFDEDSIVADTELGILMLRGTNLHVSKLNLDDGELSIEGEIDSLEYTEGNAFSKGKGSFFSKIFK